MTTAKRRASAASAESDALRRHRTRVLLALLDICRNIERLQVSPMGRKACREVAALLGTTLAREMAELKGPDSSPDIHGIPPDH